MANESTKKDDLSVSEHFVCFLDILGYKELIKPKNLGENELLRIQNEAIRETFEQLKIDKVRYDAIGFAAAKIDVNIFSDNFLLSVKTVEDVLGKKAQLIRLFNFIADLQSHFYLKYGLAVRGAIVCGTFYRNDNFAFGQAIVDAYTRESNLAIYPRIIISQECIDLLVLTHDDYKNQGISKVITRLNSLNGLYLRQDAFEIKKRISTLQNTFLFECNELLKMNKLGFIQIFPDDFKMLDNVCKKLNVDIANLSEKELLAILESMKSQIEPVKLIAQAAIGSYYEGTYWLVNKYTEEFTYRGEDGAYCVNYLYSSNHKAMIDLAKSFITTLPKEAQQLFANVLSANQVELIKGKLASNKNRLLDDLQKYKENPYVLQKYQWSATYHNSICIKTELSEYLIENI